MGDELLVARQGGVRVLSLNRPDRMNALNGALRAALLAALRDAQVDAECRAVLLRAEGRGFCAGQDLADVREGADLGDLLRREYNPIVEALRTMPKPVVCAVAGVAAGAGANIALACDVVLAGESARFLQAFVRIGLVPDSGGTWLLPRLAGDARARGMALLGEPVSAAQAEAWGMIWRVLPDDALLDEAMRTADALAQAPTASIALIKQALDRSATNSVSAQLALEADLQSKAGASPDFREGVRAFLEKRPPRFTGQPA